MEQSLNQSVNNRVSSEMSEILDGAIRYINYVLTQMEGDGSRVDECVQLWRILQSLVSFKAKFDFANRLGIWSLLVGCSSDTL